MASQVLEVKADHPAGPAPSPVSGSGSHPLKALIQLYAKDAPERPFLQHVDYFAGEAGRIDKSSISAKWSALTGDHWTTTGLKAWLTIRGANQQAQATVPGCPWRATFGSSAEIMPCLKHPCDTSVVREDGSVDLKELERMMEARFEFDGTHHFVRRSAMLAHLKECARRDTERPTRSGILMPAWATVAEAEWLDAFAHFCDCWKLDSKGDWEPAITAETFLQFYFRGRDLWDRVLRKELPVSRPPCECRTSHLLDPVPLWA